jgi:hypothetical protein
MTAQLPRKQASILIQLRTGHVPFNRHLYTIGKVTLPLCLACNEREETVHHFLFVCSAYDEQRHRLGRTIGSGGTRVDTLLNDPKALPSLFCFIHDTNHFHDTFGDIHKTGTT